VYMGERDMGDMRDFLGEVSGRERRERGLWGRKVEEET
jgi:hypothetical protein